MIHLNKQIAKAPTEVHSVGAFHHILPIIALLLIAAATQLRYINEFPLYVHAWAQADWYSLAIGYVDNGMDFFHPTTMFGNKQFAPPSAGDAAYFTVDSTPVTSSDFPIIPYLVALLMKLFGTTAPWVFRGSTLLLSLFGLYCLYRIVLLLSNCITRSLLVAATAFTAPIFTYYCGGFLPSMPAFAFSAAGIWAYLLHLQHEQRRHFGFAIGFLVLAAMVRSSYWVPVVAVLCYDLLRLFHKTTSWRHKWPILIAALLPAILWALWNNHLRQQYGSMFLGNLMPPKSLDNVHEIYQQVHDRWRYDYFQQIQHWIVLATAIVAIIFAIIRHQRMPSNDDQRHPHPIALSSVAILVVIWCLGEILFVVAMMRQYVDHDYYFLDSLFLPLMLIFAIALSSIPSAQKVWQKTVDTCMIVALVGLMVWQASSSQQHRRLDGDRSLQCYQHYQGADQLLDDAGIPHNAKILVLFAYPTSSPFIEMQRRGFIVLDTEESLIRNALTFDYDYIVVEKDVWEQEEPTTKELIEPGTLLTQNNFLLVFNHRP